MKVSVSKEEFRQLGLKERAADKVMFSSFFSILSSFGVFIVDERKTLLFDSFDKGFP